MYILTKNFISKYLFISVFLFFIFYGKTQNDTRDYMEIDTILTFPHEVFHEKAFVGTTWKNHFVFSNYHRSNQNDSVFIYRVNLSDFHVDTFVCFCAGIGKYMQNIQVQHFESILYNEKYLILGFYNQLIVLRANDNERSFDFDLYRTITLKQTYNSVAQFIDETKILLGDMYYSHKPSTLLTIYDIENNEILKKINPYYNHVLWQYYPSKHAIDYRNSQILFSHRGEYSFIVYDTLFQKKDSVVRNIDNWKSLSFNTISYIKKKFKKNAAADIMNYLSHLLWKMDHFWSIYFLKENQIMTIYLPHKEQSKQYSRYRIDVWNKENHTWKLYKKDITDEIFGKFTYVNDTLTKTSFPIGILSGNQLFVSEKYFIVLQKDGTNFNPIGLSKNDYWTKHNAYFVQKDACIQIFFYKYHF